MAHSLTTVHTRNNNNGHVPNLDMTIFTRIYISTHKERNYPVKNKISSYTPQFITYIWTCTQFECIYYSSGEEEPV